MLFAPHVTKKYNIQDYITNQITHFNLQVGHAGGVLI
jgi:hypothetical protein